MSRLACTPAQVRLFPTICVLIDSSCCSLLYICARTYYARMHSGAGAAISLPLTDCCTGMYVSAYPSLLCMRVLRLLDKCRQRRRSVPHTAVLLYMCPHRLLTLLSAVCVSPHTTRQVADRGDAPQVGSTLPDTDSISHTTLLP